jgi:hypothetical protein
VGIRVHTVRYGPGFIAPAAQLRPVGSENYVAGESAASTIRRPVTVKARMRIQPQVIWLLGASSVILANLGQGERRRTRADPRRIAHNY